MENSEWKNYVVICNKNTVKKIGDNVGKNFANRFLDIIENSDFIDFNKNRDLIVLLTVSPVEKETTEDDIDSSVLVPNQKKVDEFGFVVNWKCLDENQNEKNMRAIISLFVNDKDNEKEWETYKRMFNYHKSENVRHACNMVFELGENVKIDVDVNEKTNKKNIERER